MGKLNYLLVSLLIGIVLVSCQKDDLTPVTSKGATASGQNSGGTSASSSDNNSNNSISSTSNSSNGSSVTPQIIAGANNGGNRTCEEVGLAFMNDASYFDLCGEKIDYSDGGFKGEFPEGLNVSTDGKYVSFEEVLKDQEARDLTDSARSVAPLIQAKDAVPIQCDHMSAVEVADEMMRIICKFTEKRS